MHSHYIKLLYVKINASLSFLQYIYTGCYVVIIRLWWVAWLYLVRHKQLCNGRILAKKSILPRLLFLSHFKLAALLITQRTLRLRLCGKLDIFSCKFETSPKKIAFDNRDCLPRHFCWNYWYSYYKDMPCSSLFRLINSFDCGINNSTSAWKLFIVNH